MGENPQILILGSLPGWRSIECDEYYAHPRNAFWRIMAELVAASGDYSARCQAVTDSGIAIWDVLASSVRPGSLDADIDLATARANDFAAFFTRYPNIHRVCFNGKAAARIFRQRVPVSILPDGISLLTLPSTSPAYAAMKFSQKLERWRAGIELMPNRD